MGNMEMDNNVTVDNKVEMDYLDLALLPMLYQEEEQKEYKPIIPKKHKMPRSKKIFIFSMLAYPVVHFIVFWFFINFDTIVKSFQQISYLTGEEYGVGFKNYIYFFKDFSAANGVLKDAVVNSLLFFVFNNFILLPISMVCAYLLFKKVFMEKIFRIIFFLPNIISIVVLSMVFKFMFDDPFGPITQLLRSIGINVPTGGPLQQPGTAQIMIFVYCLWAGIGYNVLLLSGSIARIPSEVFEAGTIDGIGMTREFVQMVVPLIMPTVSTLFVTGSMVMFTLFLQPKLLTGGEFGTYTLALYIVSKVEEGGVGLYRAAAAGMVVSIVGIPLVQGFKWIMEKITPSVEF